MVIAGQGMGQDLTEQPCGFPAQLLHPDHGLLTSEVLEVPDGTMVWTPQIRTVAVSRAGVGPSTEADQASAATERDDLPSIHVMKVSDLRAQGMDCGVHLGYRASVIIMIAGHKVDRSWCAC